MNPAHLHLALIHFPIASTILALPLLCFALWRRGEWGATAAAAFLLVTGAASALAAQNTGEGAEELVEGLPGVSAAAIQEHEERAEVATVLAVIAGVAGLGAAGLAFKEKASLARLALGVTLLADGAAAGAMAWTGNAGGQIRHPEISDGAGTSASATRGVPADEGRVEEGEDDDE
jgi:hypothetical protein